MSKFDPMSDFELEQTRRDDVSDLVNRILDTVDLFKTAYKLSAATNCPDVDCISHCEQCYIDAAHRQLEAERK